MLWINRYRCFERKVHVQRREEERRRYPHQLQALNTSPCAFLLRTTVDPTSSPRTHSITDIFYFVHNLHFVSPRTFSLARLGAYLRIKEKNEYHSYSWPQRECVALKASVCLITTYLINRSWAISYPRNRSSGGCLLISRWPVAKGNTKYTGS